MDGEGVGLFGGDRKVLRPDQHVDGEDWKRWRANLNRLRIVLAPPSPSIPLFDVEQ